MSLLRRLRSAARALFAPDFRHVLEVEAEEYRMQMFEAEMAAHDAELAVKLVRAKLAHIKGIQASLGFIPYQPPEVEDEPEIQPIPMPPPKKRH